MNAGAEIEKLARLLGDAPERFAYLERVPPEDIRALREAATDRLFDADRKLFERIGAAAAVVPDALAATLSRKAFGPLITARVSTAVDPAKAVSVAGRLPQDFLADVAVELDPRRAAAVLRGLPAAHIAATSRILADRGEWVAMGRFVGHLPDDALRRVIDGLAVAELVRIAHVLEDAGEAGRVARLIGAGRLRAMLAIARDEGLEDEAQALLDAAGIEA